VDVNVERPKMRVLASVSALLGLCHALALSSERGVISKLSRTIELSNGLSRVQTSLTLDSRDTLSLAVPAALHGNLSHLTAQSKDSKSKIQVVKRFHDLQTRVSYGLPGQGSSLARRDAFIYDLDLSQETASELSLTVTEIYAHISKPLPAQLEQSSQDGQYFLWNADLLGGWSVLNEVAEAKVRVKYVHSFVGFIAT
jgi:hypothetical protein